MPRTRFTLGEFRSIGHAMLDKLKKQEQAGILKSGAYGQVQWVLLELDKALETLPNEVGHDQPSTAD